MAPLQGEMVGVGTPVVVSFVLPMTDRRAFERRTTVTSSAAQVGHARTFQMKVSENGAILRTVPVTTGKPGSTTRSGVKAIMESSSSGG